MGPVRVSLFVTCFNDTLFPQAGMAAVEVLERLGHEVEFREAQTCCGQMHFNSGYRPEALRLARRFAKVFAGADAIVSPSASCAGMVRHGYAELARWAGDLALEREADELAGRTFELSEFLVDRLGVEDVGAYYPHRVTLHPTCHSLRALGTAAAQRRLLEHVRGIDLVELADADECCGFGGTFAVKNADTSVAMGSDKVRAVLDTRAEVVAAADTSCLMHIGGLLSRGRTGVRTAHIAEILASREP
jgi:L-lactate dehydrogenase complex protein LldE